MPRPGDIYFDSNGALTECRRIGDLDVTVHYDDVPEKDITTVDGIPCTTALRTVIDLAPDTEPHQLERMIQDCLRRRLFTVEEALARVSEPDMLRRPGAVLLRRMLPAPGELPSG